MSGLKTVGLVAAEVIGLIDRDFYSDEVLDATTGGVSVLPLHEIESVLCDHDVVRALAEHFGKSPIEVWDRYLDRLRKDFRGKTLNNVVACRVRSRVGDLLDGAFSGAQVAADFVQTVKNHSEQLSALDPPTKTATMFEEEYKRVEDALAGGGKTLLAILPGKHLLSILGDVLGLRSTSELSSLVLRSLNRELSGENDPVRALETKVEKALLEYLPRRRV